MIDEHDIDGHTKTESFSFMDQPNSAVYWAIAFTGAWRQNASGAGSNDFVMQMMWDDKETSYHAGIDMSYRSKLVSV